MFSLATEDAGLPFCDMIPSVPSWRRMPMSRLYALFALPFARTARWCRSRLRRLPAMQLKLSLPRDTTVSSIDYVPAGPFAWHHRPVCRMLRLRQFPLQQRTGRPRTLALVRAGRSSASCRGACLLPGADGADAVAQVRVSKLRCSCLSRTGMENCRWWVMARMGGHDQVIRLWRRHCAKVTRRLRMIRAHRANDGGGGGVCSQLDHPEKITDFAYRAMHLRNGGEGGS